MLVKIYIIQKLHFFYEPLKKLTFLGVLYSGVLIYISLKSESYCTSEMRVTLKTLFFLIFFPNFFSLIILFCDASTVSSLSSKDFSYCCSYFFAVSR